MSIPAPAPQYSIPPCSTCGKLHLGQCRYYKDAQGNLVPQAKKPRVERQQTGAVQQQQAPYYVDQYGYSYPMASSAPMPMPPWMPSLLNPPTAPAQGQQSTTTTATAPQSTSCGHCKSKEIEKVDVMGIEESNLGA